MAYTTEMNVNGVLTNVTHFDHSAQEIDDAVARAKYLNNTNLLDNWCFVNPVDQRGGYVVPPGTAYYVPGIWDTVDGTTTGYTKVDRFFIDNNDKFPIIVVNGADRVCTIGTAVRGYTGFGYTIDRWFANYGDTLMQNGFIRRYATDEYCGLLNYFEPDGLLGKTCTFSILGKWDGAGNQPYLTVYAGDVVYLDTTVIGTELDVYSCTVTFPTNLPTSDIRFGVDIVSMTGSTLDVYAAKLELGTQQTLAHQENGVWVLNEIPNYADELAKCQRYYYSTLVESGEGGCVKAPVWDFGKTEGSILHYASGISFPVTMRANPVVNIYSAIRRTEGKVSDVHGNDVGENVFAAMVGKTGISQVNIPGVADTLNLGVAGYHFTASADL